jgi:hypothetical protein
VYTEQEWRALDRQGKFPKTLAKEVVWVWEAKGTKP